MTRETARYFIATATNQNAICVDNPGGADVYDPYRVALRFNNRTDWEQAAANMHATVPAVGTLNGMIASVSYGILQNARGQFVAWRLGTGQALTFNSREWTELLPQTTNYNLVQTRCIAIGITPPQK